MTRTQKTVFISVAIVAVILGLIVQRVLSGHGGADQAALVDAGIIMLPQSRPVPALKMTDQHGEPVSIDQLKDKWTLVFFGYTYCPDICPATLAQLRQIKAGLTEEQAGRLRVVLVSVDPERDTPEQLRQYLEYFDKSFIGLRASVADLKTLSSAMSIPFIPADTSKPGYTVDHSGNLALLGPDGRQRGFIRAPLNVKKLSEQLPVLLKP
ncbi:SCO family protein [Pseudomonas sp. 21LCFQ02]|uniref:SCO family protein n=1 Tax=unclassified Pseudomonas TaxID=196821 RepID=UPI0004F5CEAF|nr:MULTISPECIES: SCO family protein [unclassified Pseudomonas]MCO8162427.1 SCO family protein [Pseudomonas sp. 21LCFQ010]MCO8168943.1 SCO family protein [Pseudomonas sp. 21LCFQ02]MCQ9423590.1 SCO family protein [Pseudomonas sp. LJDD11]BAP42352.1 Sco1/SenC family protein [Pseudomonas sp. StFLB209]